MAKDGITNHQNIICVKKITIGDKYVYEEKKN